jgi:D-alanyl-D-alanine carboxypeptidase/D-alanyl-D-alanine-endopeptidase (penicillin-binding protein 4)
MINPGAQVGIAIKSMKYGDTLYTKNERSLFVPASTMKILTAEAALLYLGPNFKFPTRLVTDARSVSNGTLNGNLFVVHSGDPSLTYNDVADLLYSLKSQQIQKINGNVYIDNTAYDQVNFGPGWIWNDKKNCYGAPINASIINHNCISFRATGLKNNSLGFGSVVTDVMQNDKNLLQNLFQYFGIHIDGYIIPGTASSKLAILATHHSKPLSQLITDMLKKSDNIIAGSLFKKIGQLYNRRPGTWENGGTAVAQILSQNADLDIWRMNLIDGSGLSRYNQVTPAQMLKVLDFAYHHNQTNYEFISALPIAGIDGTLKKRLRNVAWKARAKTGTLSGVRSLAGFAMSADKEPIAFVIMINGRGTTWKYKELEDKIVTLLTHYTR